MFWKIPGILNLIKLESSFHGFFHTFVNRETKIISGNTQRTLIK